MLPLKDLTSLVVVFTLSKVVFDVICYVLEKIRILVVRVMEWENHLVHMPIHNGVKIKLLSSSICLNVLKFPVSNHGLYK